MRRTIALVLSAILVVAFAAPALADPPADPGSPIEVDHIYADGELLGTILLGSLPFNGNENSFDNLYLVPDQAPVAEAAQGPEYNGGRWIPTPVTWNVASYPITSYEALMTAAGAGHVTIGAPNYSGTFLCPLIPNH